MSCKEQFHLATGIWIYWELLSHSHMGLVVNGWCDVSVSIKEWERGFCWVQSVPLLTGPRWRGYRGDRHTTIILRSQRPTAMSLSLSLSCIIQDIQNEKTLWFIYLCIDLPFHKNDHTLHVCMCTGLTIYEDPIFENVL